MDWGIFCNMYNFRLCFFPSLSLSRVRAHTHTPHTDRRAPTNLFLCASCTLILLINVDIDIEEMTQKTGNYKKFAVFVRMLSTALSRTGESVFIDLLTPSDLELLKARKSKTGMPVAPVQPSQSNKRYVILTYVVEFDRYFRAVHHYSRGNK